MLGAGWSVARVYGALARVQGGVICAGEGGQLSRLTDQDEDLMVLQMAIDVAKADRGADPATLLRSVLDRARNEAFGMSAIDADILARRIVAKLNAQCCLSSLRASKCPT